MTSTVSRPPSALMGNSCRPSQVSEASVEEGPQLSPPPTFGYGGEGGRCRRRR